MKNMKNIIIAVIVIILIGLGGYFLYQNFSNDTDIVGNENGDMNIPEAGEETGQNTEEDQTNGENESETTIGSSVEGRSITAYHYGEGDTELLFVGGIHGGYETNTSLVAYGLMDYLDENPDTIPANIAVTVIPVLNPDGLYETVGTSARFAAADVPSSQTERIEGRFNAHNVDLNRNFDCDWQATGTWQNTTVDAGDAAFSEPESQAIRTYVETNDPDAVVVWYSAAGGVFASSCHNGVLSETSALTNLYADASGYPAYEEFDFYEITGDMVNWLAKNGTPAISVLLSNHEDIEWTKNRAGIEALFDYYAR